MVTLTNVIIWCCTPAVLNDERGSLRSRSAAAVSSLTLRQISAVLPAGQAWSVWVSRQIVARVMDTFGPSLAGTHVTPVDTRTSDGRRVVGEWVYGAGVPRRSGRYRNLFRPRQWLRPVLTAHPSPADLVALPPDRTTGVQRRLSASTAPSIPQRRRRCPVGLGLARRTISGWRPKRPSSQATPQAGICPSTFFCNPTSSTRPRWCCSPPSST